jgi:hypothetical protein
VAFRNHDEIAIGLVPGEDQVDTYRVATPLAGTQWRKAIEP